MKYRVLTYEELEERTPQFLQFLAQHGIDTSQWSKLLEENPQRALNLVEDFSDLVMEDTLNQIEFLEKRSQNKLRVFKMLETKIVVITLQVQAETKLNLCRHASIARLLAGFDHNMWNLIDLNISEYQYEQERSQKIFQLMQQDCFITKASEFDALYNLGRRRAA